MSKKIIWHKVLNNKKDLAENRVMTVDAGYTQVCLTNVKGTINALTNKCPHQGGPLGEGSIENGLLRCPWHGWDFNDGIILGFNFSIIHRKGNYKETSMRPNLASAQRPSRSTG